MILFPFIYNARSDGKVVRSLGNAEVKELLYRNRPVNLVSLDKDGGMLETRLFSDKSKYVKVFKEEKS